MEASAVHAPAALSRLPLAGGLLRLRSDEQLLALFRAGNDEAFRVLHDRYRQRLFAYVRQMLSATSRQDAEDVLQDVFVRAYGSLRSDDREMNVRAWLYRVAHNRCIDHLRRPVPPAAELFEVSRKPLHDPVEEAQRRDDLRRLVLDVANLPEQQRSALLMREIDGMTYADLAVALDVTVPAVKSLLVRARVGLVEAAEARDADCGEIRADLLRSYDRGVKASGRARKHMRSCDACSEYRGALRGIKRSFASLAPVGFGPFALAAKLIGVGGSAGGAAAGGAAASAGGVATATACKVAAVVCTAAIATGGAVEVKREIVATKPAPAKAQKERAKRAVKAAVVPPVVVGRVGRPQVATLTAAPVAVAAAAATTTKAKVAEPAREKPRRTAEPARLQRSAGPIAPPADTEAPAVEREAAPADPQVQTGGARAPDPPATVTPRPTESATTQPSATPTGQPQTTPAPSAPAAESPTAPTAGGTPAPAVAAAEPTPPPGG